MLKSNTTRRVTMTVKTKSKKKAPKAKAKKSKSTAPKAKAPKKKSMKKATKTTQKLELKASITDEQGNVSEVTKPFGEDIVIMENMCNVGLSVGETINTGDYNNRKFQVSLHVPCHTSEMNAIFKAVTKKVDEWADEIKSEIESGI